MEITNKVIKHPKSQMTSVTDNVIKNSLNVSTYEIQFTTPAETLLLNSLNLENKLSKLLHVNHTVSVWSCHRLNWARLCKRQVSDWEVTQYLLCQQSSYHLKLIVVATADFLGTLCFRKCQNTVQSAKFGLRPDKYAARLHDIFFESNYKVEKTIYNNN